MWRETLNNHSRDNGIGAFHSYIIFLLLITTLAPSATAADAMFRANAEHTGVFDEGGFIPIKDDLWRFKTGGHVYSSPTVSNGVVYVGSDDNNLYAIDAVTGKEKWRFKTGGYVESSPAVSDGVVYVGSQDNILYAIDALTGTEKWLFRIRTTGSIYSSASPTVSNGVVFFGGVNHILYAINAGTGKEKWQFKEGYNVYSSPAVSNGIVYVGINKNLYAIDAMTGKEKWRFSTGAAVQSSPAVSNGVVYIGSNDNNLYAIQAMTGKEKWRFATGNLARSSPAVSNGVVYFGSNDGHLYAVGGVPAGQVNTPTDVATPRIQNSPQPILPSNSGNSNPITNTTDLSTQIIQSIYWSVVLILLIGILLEGWKAVKPGK